MMMSKNFMKNQDFSIHKCENFIVSDWEKHALYESAALPLLAIVDRTTSDLKPGVCSYVIEFVLFSRWLIYEIFFTVLNYCNKLFLVFACITKRLVE